MAHRDPKDLAHKGRCLSDILRDHVRWLSAPEDHAPSLGGVKNAGMQADLRGADLAGVELSGVTLIDAIMTGADLRGANLARAFLINADLRAAWLSAANMQGAFLINADLRASSLSGANMHAAFLAGARLDAADLTGANLTSASFRRTDLRGTIFHGAIFGGTSISFCDLSETIGLETVTHEGLSSLGIETVLSSRGKIADSFSRAGGVPEAALSYFRALGGESLHSIDCFICHSAHDKDFVDRLDGDLKACGIRSWYFPKDAEWGQPVWREIDLAIRHSTKLVLVCSKNSLESEPVHREIERALQREDEESREILVAVRIDDYVFGWKHRRRKRVLSKVVGDFCDWRDSEKYVAALNRFVKFLSPQMHQSHL